MMAVRPHFLLHTSGRGLTRRSFAVGTISVDYTFVRKRDREEDVEVSEEDIAKRTRYDEGMSEEQIGYYPSNPQHGEPPS